MKAIASLEASEVAGAVQEESTDAADGSRSTLNTLIGTDTTGGALQVTIACGEGEFNTSLLALIAISVVLEPRMHCHTNRCRLRYIECRV